MVLGSWMLHRMGRGVGDPVEVRPRPGQPSEIVAWYPSHPASPDDSRNRTHRADPTIGPYVRITAPTPPSPDDSTTSCPTAPLWLLQNPGLHQPPHDTARQPPTLDNPTAMEDTYDYR